MLIQRKEKINTMMIGRNKHDVYYAGNVEILMTSIRERIQYILKSEGLKQKELAAIVNASPQTVNNWMKRDTISRDAAQQIAQQLNFSLDWLLSGKGEPKGSSPVIKRDELPPESEWTEISVWDRDTPLSKDEVEVPFLRDIEFACGDGSVGDDDYNGFKLRFSKATLRRVGAKTDGSGVLCFPARGDSMEPFIPDGTTVAINCDDKRIIDGKVYAVNQDGWKRLKMLYRVGPDRVSLRSFNNKEHPPEEHSLSEVEIVGRMFWTATMW